MHPTNSPLPSGAGVRNPLLRFGASALLIAAFVPTASAATILKANNGTALDQTASWTGGAVPTSGDIAAFSSANTASTTAATIGNGVSFGGISYVSNPGVNITINAGTGGTLTLGASGIDLSLGSRLLTLGSTVNLAADQTWTTGTNTTTQISSTGIISGSGKLTIAGTSGSPYAAVYLNALNTFTGGVVLNSTGALRLGSAAATVAGGLPTASSIGTGNLTINGGTIFGGGSNIAPQLITVNSDFNLNVGTNALNGRLTIGGGSVDLTGGTRTVSLGRFQTASNSLVSGSQSLSFVLTTNAPTISVSNGTLRLVRESVSSPTASDYVSVNFGAGTNFAAGAGFTVGDHVITTFATGNPFGTTAGAQPIVTVESGGYFNMSDQTAARSPIIRTLSGAGTVTNFSNGTTSSAATLNVNPQSGDTATFSGTITDGSNLTSVVAAAVGTVAVTKTGAGTQILSGTNSYSGVTTVSAGTLQFAKQASLYNNTSASWTAANLNVASGATLAFNVGGTGEFTSADLDTLQTNLKTGIVSNGYRGGSIMGLDTTNAVGGTFTYNTALVNSTGTGAGSVGLNKLGAGTLVLGATASTYTGATTVTAGTLIVNGAINSTPTVTVGSGALLGGTGTIGTSAGAATINGGITPGDGGIGTLTVRSNTTWNAGTDWKFELGTAGISLVSFGTSDLLNIVNTGNVLAKGTGTNFVFDFQGTGDVGWYKIVDWVGGTSTFVGSDFVASNLTAGLNGSFTVDAVTTALYLEVTAVPEPSSWALIGTAFGFLAVIARRRRSRMN